MKIAQALDALRSLSDRCITLSSGSTSHMVVLHETVLIARILERSRHKIVMQATEITRLREHVRNLERSIKGHPSTTETEETVAGGSTEHPEDQVK
jgi:hypothetical protein